MKKTNAMRLLDTAGIPYGVVEYDFDEEHPCGVGRDALDSDTLERSFKTLVTQGDSGPVVFCIPVREELDLKKCAAAAGQKRVEMIHVKEITALTGYVRGGCSPVGMKKPYPVYFDETALLFEKIFLSAGQRGMQIEAAAEPVAALVGAAFADLIRG